jgi:hypothetical protein
MLIAEFPRYLAVFEQAPPFGRCGQLEFHLETIRLRRKHESVAHALGDDRYLHALYRTLQAWGIGARGSNLVPVGEFVKLLRAKTPELAAFENLSIDNPMDVGAVCAALWQTIDTLGIVANNTRVVPGTKALHHVLPNLVVPVDRAYTQRFFRWHNPEFQYGQADFFAHSFSAFVRIARGVRPAQYVGGGWNSSRTKVIDNAIVGMLREEQEHSG